MKEHIQKILEDSKCVDELNALKEQNDRNGYAPKCGLATADCPCQIYPNK